MSDFSLCTVSQDVAGIGGSASEFHLFSLAIYPYDGSCTRVSVCEFVWLNATGVISDDNKKSMESFQVPFYVYGKRTRYNDISLFPFFNFTQSLHR